MAYQTIPQGFSVGTAQYGRKAHPDILANRICQRIVAYLLSEDPLARADLNLTLGNKFILLSGQVKAAHPLRDGKLEQFIRSEIREAGYSAQWGYEAKQSKILTDIDAQSPNLQEAVGRGGAGDTIVKLGYATNETPELLPLPTLLARKVGHALDEAFVKGEIQGLGPDGKINVGVVYGNGKPVYVDHVVVGALHQNGIDKELYAKEVTDIAILPSVGRWHDIFRTGYTVNGTGTFNLGGPKIDRGIKGKKDPDHTYGNSPGTTGGSAYGKDPSKVDFHALVTARWIAKSIVAAGLAERVIVQLGYTIGKEQPTVLSFDTLGSSEISGDGLADIVRKNFPLAPAEVSEALGLRRNPNLYIEVADHFFANQELPWENPVKLQ